jgi:hypothetical protein
LGKIWVAANNIRTEIGIADQNEIITFLDKIRESRINASRDEHRKHLLLGT